MQISTVPMGMSRSVCGISAERLTPTLRPLRIADHKDLRSDQSAQIAPVSMQPTPM